MRRSYTRGRAGEGAAASTSPDDAGGGATDTRRRRDGLYPNPFNQATWIPYTLRAFGRATVSIYDLLGRRVNILVDAEHRSGRYRVLWDGAVASGQPVATGVYFYELQMDGGAFQRKMVLSK